MGLLGRLLPLFLLSLLGLLSRWILLQSDPCNTAPLRRLPRLILLSRWILLQSDPCNTVLLLRLYRLHPLILLRLFYRLILLILWDLRTCIFLFCMSCNRFFCGS
jgi:hypothetical protein